MLNFIDLFAGCGGLSEGFYKQGYRALTHVEIDSFSCESLKRRMQYYGYDKKKEDVLNKNITDGDIIECLKNKTNEEITDILLGGPPCQSFSSLGRAKDPNGMKSDPRNYLFESYEKILDYLKPKIFIFENVMGLLTAKLGSLKTIDVIIKKLSKNYNLSKDINKMILNSCEFGVPQIRKRIFLIGIRKDINLNIEDFFKLLKKTHYCPDSHEKEKKKKKKFISVREAISDLPRLLPGEGEVKIKFNVKKWNPFLKKMRFKSDSFLYDHVVRNHNKLDRMRFKEMSKNKWNFKELLKNKPNLTHPKKRVFDNSYVVQFWNRPSRTIIAHLYKDGNQFIHPDFKQERTLTVREAARLQSFPDDFYFAGSRTQQYKQIGNAVPPLLSLALAKCIKNFLINTK
ncbi:MAG: restriction endonuclease [Rickettsiales bacterium]|nr:restriction endonuclease [Rickettsiales bacterium]RPG16002.1 MAG: DNA cytosine methyltransferase [Pelagibacteraceae bacterium TMED195]|tara:strand:- start:2356 stop:3555 length:1200 start_codon:yes stop_codon:yes gene_type:complete